MAHEPETDFAAFSWFAGQWRIQKALQKHASTDTIGRSDVPSVGIVQTVPADPLNNVQFSPDLGGTLSEMRFCTLLHISVPGFLVRVVSAAGKRV